MSTEAVITQLSMYQQNIRQREQHSMIQCPTFNKISFLIFTISGARASCRKRQISDFQNIKVAEREHALKDNCNVTGDVKIVNILVFREEYRRMRCLLAGLCSMRAMDYLPEAGSLGLRHKEECLLMGKHRK